MTTKPTRCAHCRGPFVRRVRKESIFCSIACRIAAKRKEPEPRLLSFKAEGRPRIDRVCVLCHKPYQIKASQRKSSSYCSRGCMSADYQDRMRGAGNPNFSAAVREFECPACGRTFASYKPERKFCSRKCLESGDMTRRKAHKDLNHDAIVQAFRQLGCHVCELHGMGYGMPDLLVKIRNTWRLVEVKNPAGTYGRKGLSKSQQKFADSVDGAVDIVRTIEDAAALVVKVRDAA